MYQLDQTEIWRQHHRELLREAEDTRLARRLEAERPGKKRSFASAMRRSAALLLATMGLAVLLAAGAAYALDIQCDPGSNSVGNECLGTDARDTMDGTDENDDIRGMGDNDVVRGLGGKGNDQVDADDGQRDVIDCGDGRDSVEFDASLDKVKNCEVKTPL
jgi:hypothetical protein